MHRPTVRVYLQGGQDVLFELLGFGHQLREGDLFSHTSSGGTTVEYKVEKAKLLLAEVVVGGGAGRDNWDEPTLRVEVSEVP